MLTLGSIPPTGRAYPCRVDASSVQRLRAALSGTGWVERTASFARTLRSAGHPAGGLLLVGTKEEEPWHLAAHLSDEARWAGMPELAPTLVRHVVPPGARPHLAVSLERLEAVRRGETLFVVAPEQPDEHLLERVHDVRRVGGVVLALEGGEEGSELAGIAHEGLVVPRSVLPFDAAGHLVSVTAGEPAPRSGRRLPWRRRG
jgi:hypothetical protein